MSLVKSGLGCLTILLIIGIGMLVAKFLVPVVPLVIGFLVFYSSNKLRTAIFRAPQNIREITAGQVLLEGTVTKYDEELTSPYFKERCIGYVYLQNEYIPTEDGYDAKLLLNQTEFKSFMLTTQFDSIRVDGKQLDLKHLKPNSYTEHSLKPDVNDIVHSEYLLKSGDQIVLAGTAVKSFYQGFEIAKVGNEPFFVTTRNKIEAQKITYQVLKSLFPWIVIIYVVVNYFLFFAPSNNMPKSELFAFLAFFGLPILFLVFLLIGQQRKDWLSQVFQYLAAVCILSSLLTFPLLILLYMMELEFYRIFCIVISIISITALGLLFNYKKLTEYNLLTEKLTGKKNNINDVENTDEELS